MNILLEKQIAARSQMYMNSSREAFERGKTRAHGVPPLPAYPGDGQTRCLTNCKCEWVFEPTETGVNCYWKLNPAEHCDDCLNNAARWNPLVQTITLETEAQQVAADLMSTARAKEPEITDAVAGAVSRHGGDMHGLRYRLKTEESLARKLGTWAEKDGTTALSKVGQINDAVRYTAILDEAAYAEGVTAIQDDLVRAGYKQFDNQWKNYWKPGNPYKGYNAVFEDAAGFRFELQFHTAESMAAKGPSHILYQQARVLPTGPEKTALIEKMQRLWDDVASPLGWESLPGVTL